ncbi:MAG TPA: hypothetical protein VFG79_16970 [Solirubrobacter sp.]|nr:hypothetical protein [Solirubrobacter sp.]
MSAAPGVIDAAATLLDADPGLSRALGPRTAAEVARNPVLPVLAVPAGLWTPPDRAALGPGTVALAVVDGLLKGGAGGPVMGPGDVIEPWDGGDWRVCTPARLAVIGVRFLEAVRPWPGAAARLLARVRTGAVRGHPRDGDVDERVLALLWAIAARWGTLDGAAVALPRGLDTPALAALLDLPEAETAAAVGVLTTAGSVTARVGHAWRVVADSDAPAQSGHSRARRDELRARGAQQLALARAVRADYVTISEQAQAQLAAGRARRASTPQRRGS